MAESSNELELRKVGTVERFLEPPYRRAIISSIFAGAICLFLAWLLQLIGFNITSSDIISSTFGFILLLSCMIFTGLVGVGFGISFSAWINKLFGGGK